MTLFLAIEEVLFSTTKEEKFIRFETMYREYKNGVYSFTCNSETKPLVTPSYSSFCEVRAMRDMPKKNKKATNDEKRIDLLHSVAHIEYSAVDIALDAAYRFRDMPKAYYDDWLEVAEDEIRHFLMIEKLLEEYDSFYGALPVHNGLFEALKKSSDSIVKRMALLPRYMEANGLDANPIIMKKLANDKTNDAIIKALQIILEEEVDHVRKGDVWYKYACEHFKKTSCDYVAIIRNMYPRSFEQKRILNTEARLRAGFSKKELEMIEDLAKK